MLSLLLAGSVASAYSLSGYAWPPDRLPVELHWTGEQEGFTHDELTAAIERAAAAWEEAAPCPLEIVVVEDAEAVAWFDAGGMAFLFGDPNDELEADVLAMGVPGEATGTAFTSNGRDYEPVPALLMVFNDGDFWLPDGVINGGACVDQFSLQSALTHDIGLMLGLAALAEGDAESDPDATMYWALAVCDTSWSTLDVDDIDGIEAIYAGSYGFTFTCAAAEGDRRVVECAATGASESEAALAMWDFGDGATAQGGTVSHTYAVEDTYWIEVCFPSATCDEGRCDSVEHRAGDPIPASEPWSAWNGESDDTCGGCAATGGSEPLGLLVWAAWMAQRRLRSPRGGRMNGGLKPNICAVLDFTQQAE